MPNCTFGGKGIEAEVYNAVRRRDVSKFRELLDNGFDPNHIFTCRPFNFEHCSVLKLAVKNNFRHGIEILLRETNVDTEPGFSEACVQKDEEVIRVFLQIASETRSCSSEYLLILLRHKVVNMAVEFIQMSGFDVNDQSLCILYNGQSPLHVGMVFLNPQILECLIERGAKLDIKDADDCTPLYVACTHGSPECCLCLLRHGANPNLNETVRQRRDGSLRSPLYSLFRLSMSSVQEEIIGLLLSAGLDMNQERWVLDRPRRQHMNDDTLRLLTSLCAVPSTLETICVRAIRQHLSKLTTGRSILTRVQGLPVPLLLKARLIVSGFDQ